MSEPMGEDGAVIDFGTHKDYIWRVSDDMMFRVRCYLDGTITSSFVTNLRLEK